MKKPDLGRYDEMSLESMLYSYRALSREHLDQGHYALAKWATRMVTYITLELNARTMRAQDAVSDQLTID